MQKSNSRKFTHDNVKELLTLTKLVSKYSGEFIAIAKNRRMAIKRIYKEALSGQGISDHSLSSLKNCIDTEFELEEILRPKLDRAKLLLVDLNPVAYTFLKKNEISSAWNFKFSSMRFYGLLEKQWPLIKKLFFLFVDYLDHLKIRANHELDLIKTKSTGMLFKGGELRNHWKKDKEFFDIFVSHLNELSGLASEMKHAGIISSSLLSLGSAVSFTLAFSKSFVSSEEGLTGWAFVFGAIFAAVATFNLALCLAPASKKEKGAINILDSFTHSI